MNEFSQGEPSPSSPEGASESSTSSAQRRRRGSRGGRNRGRSGSGTANLNSQQGEGTPDTGSVDPQRRPQIGDTRPAPRVAAAVASTQGSSDEVKKPEGKSGNNKRRRGGRGRSGASGANRAREGEVLDADIVERRRGRERNGRPVGRYLMCVQVRDGFTQVAVLEGRKLIEHYVSRPADDDNQIYGNIYIGRVQNVLPGMEAAFVDISTPKNAVLYRGDVQ